VAVTAGVPNAPCLFYSLLNTVISYDPLWEFWELLRRREILERCARQPGATERVDAVCAVGLWPLGQSEEVQGQIQRAGWESSRRGDMGAMKVEKNHGLLYHCGNFLMAGSYSWPGAFLREFLIAGSFFHFLMGGVFDRRELIAQ